MQFPIDCYFERALHLTPDDTVVRLVYAQHLGKTDRKPAALGQLRMAQTYAEGRPLTHYNIGLVAVELGEFDLALESAHAAERMGYAQPALRQALEKAGRWREPAAEPPVAASASASAAASAASSP